LPISQRGDSGTQTRITKAISAGSTPRANRPRQPMIGPSEALKRPAAKGPAGSRLIDAPLIQPRFDAGTNSCSRGMSTAKKPPTPRPTMKRITVRKIQPRSGVSAIRPVASEKVRIVIMNTLRRPILSPSHPKKYPAGTDATPEDSRISADWP